MGKKMNESLDLRNRILKLRESNNLVTNKTNSSNNNLMSKFENSIKDDNPKKNLFSKNIDKDKIENATLRFNKNGSENQTHQQDRALPNTAKSNINENEAQFLMLAHKFNEAVEVILELSQKVDKIERNFYQNSSRNKSNKTKSTFFNLKTFIFILIVLITFLVFLTVPIDFSLIKLILTDVFSVI